MIESRSWHTLSYGVEYTLYIRGAKGEMMERIVITGYGVKAPGVQNHAELLRVLKNGECTLEILSEMGPNGSDIVAGVVHDDFSQLFGSHYKRVPRVGRLAVASAIDAMEMADLHELDTRRVGVLMGTSVGGVQELEPGAYHSFSGNYRRFPTLTAGLSNTHSLSSSVSAFLNIKGPSFTLGTGCTGATDSFLFAKMLLQTGQLDVCIAGGADAPINRACIFGFAKLNSLSINVPVHDAGVPFSAKHEGFVMSEGSGALILERESHALSRKARIYGVLDHVTASNDAISIHQSDETGESMRYTLAEAVAGRQPSYVSSQALGLRMNDTNDAFAHQSLFGTSIPITSIKGHIGHTMGASGAIQAIASMLSMDHNFIPGTIRSGGEGFEELPIVFETRESTVDSVAITTHGYGGNNGCIYITRYP